ncbi:MAG: Hsp70 family protein, partial [Deltaproteobacteria bacterium]|nr:Hsp70 family protein [Deltaproteobacteria bacterium]
ISPVDATLRYLEHLRDAWNSTIASVDEDLHLEKQDVFLTVPASFDAVARDLTMTAATRAGLTVTLLEEPQAAFYAWLSRQGESWRDHLTVGDLVLICDVGGGTTDFTLIAAKDLDGDLVLERVAVGDHILLGGDNMDLALALTVADDLKEDGHALDAWQTRSLWHACRKAKEELLSHPDQERAAVSVLGRGSKVIGGTIKAELDREDLEQILVDGFFPECAADARPKRARRIGLQELGLPYAADAGITRHLARFLGSHGRDDAPAAWPTAVLFNGGVMKAGPLRQRVVDVLSAWLHNADEGDLKELDSANLDLAVSRGAAYYGLVRRGKGIRIRGGVARSYYIGIESALPAVPGMEAPMKALCVVPFGMEEGSEASIEDQEFGMVVGEPVEFRFLSSTTRKDDPQGRLLDRYSDEEIEELSPIQTAMEGESDDPGVPIPVRLHARVTEVGTLDLDLRARDGQSWKLEYDVRDKEN